MMKPDRLTTLAKAVGAVSFFILVAALFIFPYPDAVFAQPGIDQATREVDRSMRQQVEQRFQEATPRKAPRIKDIIPEEKPEGPAFEVRTITLEGVKTFKPEDFRDIISKYEKEETTLSDLKILAKEIEREYLRKGVIAACFLPPQDIKEGAVVLRVVEAKMGQLEVKKMRYFNEDRIEYYWAIEPGEVLQYGKISRSLQFINKNPDRMAKASLHAGDKPETTDVLVEAATNFPVHITATLDHEGSPSTGKLRKGFGLVDNNLLGLDDTLILGYTGGKSFGGGYGYHRVPITNFGTMLMYGYSRSNAFPQKDYQRFEISSNSESYSAFVYQDLFQKDEYKGEFSAGLEKSSKRVVAMSSGLPVGQFPAAGATGTLNSDRITTATVNTTLISRGAGSYVTFKPEFAQGLNMLGARRKNEYSSRQAENTPTRLNLTATYKKGLYKNYQASLKFRAQFASEKLTPQQQLYLGGIDSVRGYPSGDYMADTGFYSNIELLIPCNFLPEWFKVPYGERPIKDEITGVVFFDYGAGMKRGLIQGEVSNRRMAGLGAGLRIRVLNQALLRLEWGIPLDPVVNYPLTERGGNRPRLHFSIDFQDDWPEEVERFTKVYGDEYLKKCAWQILDDEMRNPESPLRKKIYENLALAEKAQEMGYPKEAKRYYAAAAALGNNVFRQVETYLKENHKHLQSLRAASDEASRLFREGEYEKSKEMWQKVIEDAKISPLKLEML
jgi:hemolysin activation/secretion protein